MGDLLNKLEQNKKIPMHMPGHKRNTELAAFLSKLRADIDITEIDGFDNLFHAEDVLKESMEKASRIWGSDKSYYLVGGSSCGILTGIRSLTNTGDCVLMCRASHKSAYNALEICGLKCRFISGEIYNSDGCYDRINPEEIRKILNEDTSIKLVFITSPMYEGEIQAVKEIAQICHEKNIPLMVDEAHGSHLGFIEYFSGGAVKAGADLVVQSLHKTNLGLTQTGILHASGNIIDYKKLEHNLSAFQTSSPSYILMASICECVDFICENKEVFENWGNMLDDFFVKIKDLKVLEIAKSDTMDKSKILILCSKADINGKELMSILREKYNIELEMAYGNCALAMTGLGEKKENLTALANALLEIDKEVKIVKKESFSLKYDRDFVCDVNMFGKTKIMTEDEAIGKISAQHIWVYPPGIPVILRGEKITKEAINAIKKLEKHGSEILDTEKLYPLYIVLD